MNSGVRSVLIAALTLTACGGGGGEKIPNYWNTNGDNRQNLNQPASADAKPDVGQSGMPSPVPSASPSPVPTDPRRHKKIANFNGKVIEVKITGAFSVNQSISQKDIVFQAGQPVTIVREDLTLPSCTFTSNNMANVVNGQTLSFTFSQETPRSITLLDEGLNLGLTCYRGEKEEASHPFRVYELDAAFGNAVSIILPQ